jgi:hypothetical protein
MFIQYDGHIKNQTAINLNVIGTIQYCSQKRSVHIIPSILTI